MVYDNENSDYEGDEGDDGVERIPGSYYAFASCSLRHYISVGIYGLVISMGFGVRTKCHGTKCHSTKCHGPNAPRTKCHAEN